jgi:hypothetical protein
MVFETHRPDARTRRLPFGGRTPSPKSRAVTS